MSSPSPNFSPRAPLPTRPASGGRAPSRPALFPAGLVTDLQATTGEELQAAGIAWSLRYAQLQAGRLSGHWAALHTAAAQVGVEAWSLGMLKMGRAPRGAVTFLVPVQGSTRLQGRFVSPGAVAVLFEGDELDCRSAGPARLISVSVERSVLEGHVRATVGHRLGELRLQGRLSGLRTDAAQLARLVRDFADRAAAHPRVLREAAFAQDLERRLVRLLLFNLDAPCEQEAPHRGRRLARRAEAWLRENLSEPPTIAVLCSALHASERTLHEAFRSHLGTTPKAYLKVLRLNAAHHDLLQAEARTRVTDVALDWGFEHFGWFSQDYRRLFGEAPSDTLHRGQAQADRPPPALAAAGIR